MDIENAKAQMRKGVLELCILAIIEEDEVYPSDIIARLKANDLIVVEGTLYPLLTRLKNDGLLDYSWRESKTGPPRKYFKITDLGRQFLEALTSSWQQLVHSVGQTLGVPEEKKPRKAKSKTDSPDSASDEF
jgi:PadR family transcriptional regulator, regulatory protein PadR